MQRLAALAISAALVVLVVTLIPSGEDRGGSPPPAQAASPIDRPAEAELLAPPPLPDRDEPGGQRRTSRDPGPPGLLGLVVDSETGDAIPGALFHVDASALRADGKGRFGYRPSSEPSDGSSRFVVEAEGYCYLMGDLSLESAVGTGERMVFPLLASSPLEGRVVDLDGRPVQGAWVRLVLVDEQPTARHLEGTPENWVLVPESEGMRVTSSEDGTFELPGVLPRRATHALRATRYDFEDHERPFVGAAPGITTRTDITLLRRYPTGRGEVAGVVTLNGSPVKAVVTVSTAGAAPGNDPKREETSEDGFFRIGNLVAGTALLTAYPADWLDWFYGPDVELSLPGAIAGIEIVAGLRTTRDFHFDAPDGRITGNVLHPDGAPFAGGLVMAASVHGPEFLTHTNARGDYVLELPDLGVPYLVSPDPSTGVHAHQVMPGEIADFRLPKTSPVILHVRDEAGDDVHWFYLRTREAGTEDWESLREPWDDVAGGYLFPVRSGVVDLEITSPAHGSHVIAGVQVPEHGETWLEVDLEPRD